MTLQLQRLAVLLVVIGLAVVLPSVGLAASVRTSTIESFSVVLVLASTWLWWSIAVVVWRRRRAGAVLLDLGRPPQERVAHSAGVLLAGGLALWALVTPYLPWRVLALGYLSIAAYALLQSLLPLLGRVQARTGGLSLPADYIPWSRIGTYTLRDTEHGTDILLRCRAWALSAGYPLELTLHCPAAHRRALEAICAEHILTAGARRRPPAGPG